MKKSIFLLSIVLIFVLTGCFELPEKVDEPQIYEVRKSTGLYDSVSVDAEMIAELSYGTEIGAPGSNGNIPCHTNSEGMELCYVKVLDTGEVGYVLKKWTDID